MSPDRADGQGPYSIEDIRQGNSQFEQMQREQEERRRLSDAHFKRSGLSRIESDLYRSRRFMLKRAYSPDGSTSLNVDVRPGTFPHSGPWGEWIGAVFTADPDGIITFFSGVDEAYSVDELADDPSLVDSAVNRAFQNPGHIVSPQLQRYRMEKQERERKQAEEAEERGRLYRQNQAELEEAERRRYSGIRGGIRRRLDEERAKDSADREWRDSWHNPSPK